MSHIKSGPSHINVWHVLELGAYFLNTFCPVIVEHRKGDIAVELRFICWQGLMEVLSCSQLAT